MTERKYAHGRPTPSLTPDRDEGVRPACVGRWDIYDTLYDHGSGWDYRYALKAAADICGGCPLRAACLTAEDADLWASGIRAELKRRAKEAAA